MSLFSSLLHCLLEKTWKETAEGLSLVKKDKIKALKESEINRLEDLKERNSPLFSQVSEPLPDERQRAL